MPQLPELCEVHGTVTGKEGRPVPHARMFVWRKLIRDRVELTTGETNEHGEYRMRYRAEDRWERLLIEVEARSEEFDEPLRSSVVPAQADLQIDLHLETPDTSEWATLTAAMRPALEGLKLSSLVENDDHQDVSFLALEVGKSVNAIMNVIVSARLEAAFGVTAPAFYAFVRQRIPSAIPSPLLEASANFTLIDALVHRIGSLIFALSPQVQTQCLTSAVALDLIGPQYTTQIPELVAALQALRTTDLLTQPYLVGKATLGQLLSVAQIPAAKQQTFAQALTTNTQSMRNFWRTLGDGNHGFTAAEASAIERTLSLGAFVKNDVPLVQALMQRFSSGTYSENADLAKLSVADWSTLVESSGGAPAGINAAGNATPAEVFAAVVYTRVTRAYPTAALASRVAAGTFVPVAQRPPLTQFFTNNPALELVKDTISTYLAGAGDKAFTGISQDDRATVIANLRGFQRVLRIAPNVDAAQALLAQNINSATRIAAMGRQQFFVLATANGITKTDANLIFDAAAQRYAGVVSLYAQFNLDAVGVWPAAVGETATLSQLTQQAIQRDDSLATLFGSQDYCATDDCTSILSPAAYLCDLLLWLRNHPQGAGTALDVLDARRPDIRHLLLNCPNSDTELPYIDLVIELLADAVAPPADPNSTVNPPWKQTTYDATAESLLAAPEYFNQTAFVALFGANYPQSLPYSAGLDELQTCTQQLGVPLWQMRQALVPLHAPALAVRSAVAAERFGMPPHQADLVTTANLVAASVVWNTAAPPTDLAAVPAFLQAASCTYESLLELLQVSWVQGGLGIAISGLNDLCDTSTQTLTPNPLDAGFLDRAHRFLVLWGTSGYKMWELDLLLGAATVANGTLDQNALCALLAFRQLQDATRLPVDAQLALFENIDTASHRDPDETTTTSLYARLFLNPAVIAIAPDPDLAALASGGAIADPVLLDHVPAIQAALGVSAADAATLVGLTDNTLTLANLSELYRVSALAIASKLSIANLIAVAQLLDPAAANATAALAPIFATPAATLAFLAQAQTVVQPGFTIDALTYLLTPPPWSTTTQMTQAQITTALQKVQQAVVTAAGVNVDGSVIAAVAANAHPPTAAALANDVSSLILTTLQVPGTGKTLLAILEDPTFAPPSSPPAVTPAAFPNQFLAITLFDKAALMVRTLRLVASELSWLLANAATYGGLNFSQLPVTAAQPALPLPLLQTTLLLIKLVRLFTAAPPASGIQTLFDVIGGVQGGTLVNAAEAQAALATITGWAIADIVNFSAALGVTYPADYLSPQVYDALRNLEAMGTTAGATGAQLVAWAATPPDEPTAETMAAAALAVVKARYPNNDNWLAFAPTLMNPIRERRAAALAAYLIGLRDGGGNLIYGDTNGLFDYFLIDTQMTSCEVTSRIVQAYIAVQIFVERCLMNLEAPKVVVDLTHDDTWNQWPWMKRYRIWEANREVFLYPENWLIESQRPNRTETYQQFEQAVRQGESTADYLETTVLSYIDGLDGLAHLIVTGTCQDPATGSIYVVARTNADPPIYYLRSYVNSAWSGWAKIPLDIKATQVVPAMYRGRVCLFWLQVKASNEPSQSLPPAETSSNAASNAVDKYVSLSVNFSMFRNGSWAPAQAAKGTLFDKVIFPSDGVIFANNVGMTSQNSAAAFEALYSIKVQAVSPNLLIDVFRLGDYSFASEIVFIFSFVTVDFSPGEAVHLGRAVFDGRFNDLELNNAVPVFDNGNVVGLLAYAQANYGPDAQPLLPLTAPDPDLTGEPNLVPQSGALVTQPADPTQGPNQTQQLTFTSVSALEQAVGPLLNAAPVPFRVVAPDSELEFDPTAYFFFQDNRRCYYVESQRTYWTGSWWSPTPPSYPNDVPFQMRYYFRRFYHPFTSMFWEQLSSGGFPQLFNRNLQLNPDQIDTSDVFSFQNGYAPVIPPVWWDHDDVTGADREFLDFTYSASYSVYNWELFFHIPLYIADLLSQNLQFEDAQTWYRYIFDPTLQGTDPVPQRFWIPKPFSTLTASAILAQRINNLLVAVNNGDPSAIAEITSWRNDPFNPFLLADQRPVAYMKRTVMSYLDNLIAWGDNLFATDSREALSEATLLYVTASEILGPSPAAVTPPARADESYDQLEPKLDAFANAMVDIENAIGGSGGGTSGGNGTTLPAAQTFYFKIPPNATLLGYWTTVADRLYKLRHCQNLQGQALTLALFDAPIDPGLLVAAQAAGVDLDSVLSGLAVTLPNYRFTSLYTVASDFVNAVRAYGALLLSALSNSDADQLAVLTATNQLELLQAADQVFGWQVQQAQSAIDALNQALALAQQKLNFNTTQDFVNAFEVIDASINSALIINYGIVALGEWFGAIAALIPQFSFGAAGFGGSPTALAELGGKDYHASATAGANAGKALAAGLDKAAQLAAKFGTYERRQDAWNEAAAEARFTIAQTQAQIAGAELALQIAVQNQTNHQTQEAETQSQLDFLTGKFTNQDLYDWMVGQLAATYFQSYQLAYRLCLQVQACYQFELGLPTSSFIQFGYWDSLHKGLLAGEALNHDLRRMESSYLDQNRRRFEISRFISLGLLNPTALQQLLVTGACDFDLPEALFDSDYPGHYNRHLLRASVTVVYPNPGKFDNIKATLTLTANKVRTSTDVSGGYPESPVGSDPRFSYAYAAVPQKIVLGNAQDDAGLFIQTISSNLSDQRYLPFENAGAVSSWHFEMLQASNEVDLTTVGDVVLHLYYTAIDGGDGLKVAVEANNAANAPTSGTKAFSAQNDFAAGSPTVANPYPLSPWQAFFSPPSGGDETLTLAIGPGKFSPWTRGKTISVTSITVLALAWTPGDFVLEPQAPLPSADVTMTPVTGASEPNVCSATVTMPPNTPLGTWSFKIRQSSAADFKSLSKQQIGDVILLVNYTAS